MSLKISRKIFSFSGIGAAYYQHHPITRFYSANVFSAMRRSLSPLLGSSMAFSSPSIATKSAANPDVDSENEKKIVTIGQFYQDMLFRGRKDHLISIKELKKLLKMVNTPEDIKYAGLAIDWFQEKGYDFSEELNALFINKCIECNQPNIAVTRFLYRKGRIGSWSTPSSIYRLLNSLQTHQDHQSIVQLLHILAPKGVHFDIRSFEILFQTCLQMNSKESYDEVTKKAKVLLSADDYEALVKKYPSPIGENGGDAVSATS